MKAELSAPEQVSEGLYHSFPSFTTRAVLAIFHRKWWKFLTFLTGGKCSPKYVIASKQPRELTNIERGQNSPANDFFSASLSSGLKHPQYMDRGCRCGCSQGSTWGSHTVGLSPGSCEGEAGPATSVLRPPADCPWLFPAGIPSAPASVHVLNRTAHDIVISWVPGFDAFSALNSCSVQVSIHNPPFPLQPPLTRMLRGRWKSVLFAVNRTDLTRLLVWAN